MQTPNKEFADYMRGCIHKNLLLSGPTSYNTDCELPVEDDGHCIRFGSV